MGNHDCGRKEMGIVRHSHMETLGGKVVRYTVLGSLIAALKFWTEHKHQEGLLHHISYPDPGCQVFLQGPPIGSFRLTA